MLRLLSVCLAMLFIASSRLALADPPCYIIVTMDCSELSPGHEFCAHTPCDNNICPANTIESGPSSAVVNQIVLPNDPYASQYSTFSAPNPPEKCRIKRDCNGCELNLMALICRPIDYDLYSDPNSTWYEEFVSPIAGDYCYWP